VISPAAAHLDRYPGQGADRDEHRPHRSQIGGIHFFESELKILLGSPIFPDAKKSLL
jgi:hypothetical protein